jgi:hypothetical protein
VNNFLSTLLLRGTALGLSLAAGLGAAEALVRVFIPQELGVLAPWYESHPVYRFRHYPDMDAARAAGHRVITDVLTEPLARILDSLSER